MKIVHVTWGFGLGGIETMLVNIANEQIIDNEVTIIVLNPNVEHSLVATLNDKIRLICLNRAKGIKSLKAYWDLNLYLFRNHPDVIHLHYANIAKVIPLFCNRTIVTMHDVCKGENSSNLHLCKKICAISEVVRKDIWEKEHLESVVVLNGIRPELFCQKKHKEDGVFRIVQISRLLHQKKGQHILIHALSRLVRMGYDHFSLDIIGEGESEVFLKTLVVELNLEEKIHFLGPKDQTYIQTHLCEYDLFVQPSLFEGFGLTVTEAMAAKVPVLVSENQGPLEIIENGKYGYAFKNGDIEDCAEKIALFLKHENDNRLIDLATERVYNLYNVKNTAKTYLLQYSQI